MYWLVRETVRRAPFRLLLAAVAAALPAATLAATLLFIDDGVHAMTRTALAPVQLEMRALSTSLDVDPRTVSTRLRGVPGVTSVDVFGAADVIVGVPGNRNRVSARIFAVEPAYFQHHPWAVAHGDVTRGALLNAAISAAPGFAGAKRISIDLRGSSPLGVVLPVAGTLDARSATPWFAIPAGDVQGDVAVVPRSLAVDYDIFRRVLLPPLRAKLGGATAVTNPGLSELPPVSLEAHVAVSHDAYPADPGRAAAWSGTLRRVLERRAPGAIIVADDAAEPLIEASADATNALTVFLLLGIPGVLVAGALGLAAASALAEAHRREDALLRLRGASDAQLARLAVGQGVLAGAVGTLLGIAVAVAGASAVVGHRVWRGVPAGRLALLAVLAMLAGAATTAARLVPLVRASRRSALVVDRRVLPGQWTPTWLRARLDVVALGVGIAVLGANLLIGGLKPDPVQGQALGLAFFVLLGPLALWVAATLLLVRLSLRLLERRSRPTQARPLSSWRSAALRWLGRRPARSAAALTLGVLAVSFGTQVVTFVATYGSAKSADDRVAFASDLRLTPATDLPRALPDLGQSVVATTPIRTVPARVGSDRKTLLMVDPASYPAAVTASAQIVAGGGLDALRRVRLGVLVAQEVARDYQVAPGDTLPITVFPDDLDLSQKLALRVVGVFRAFPPSDPFAEMVVTTPVLPPPIPAPDLYLARSAGSPDAVAAALQPALGDEFTIATNADRARAQQRGITTLNLTGLGRIEATAAALIAALGVGVLGAFLILDRRREYAVLRVIGASTRQTLTGPVVEGTLVSLGSVLLGVPVGVGLAVLSVRVLSLFFTLPPPVVTVPVMAVGGLVIGVIVVAAAAFGLALNRVRRTDVSSTLRAP